jgi:hypothetical protein
VAFHALNRDFPRIDTRAAPLEHLNTNASLNMVQITAQKACGITQAVNMFFATGTSPSVRPFLSRRFFLFYFLAPFIT